MSRASHDMFDEVESASLAERMREQVSLIEDEMTLDEIVLADRTIAALEEYDLTPADLDAGMDGGPA